MVGSSPSRLCHQSTFPCFLHACERTHNNDAVAVARNIRHMLCAYDAKNGNEMSVQSSGRAYSTVTKKVPSKPYVHV